MLEEISPSSRSLLVTNNKWRRTLTKQVRVQPHVLSYRNVYFLKCAGEGYTSPPSRSLTNEFVLASHSLSNHNLLSTPGLFNATSCPPLSPNQHPFLFLLSFVCVCVFSTAVLLRSELKDHSSLIRFFVQLRHCVSNSVVNMCVYVHECVPVLGWSGILLHN